MPEKHHLYTALQAKPSPGIQTYRDTLFPARQTPREAPGGSVLRMAVVSQSSVKFGKKRVFLVGTINFMYYCVFYNKNIIENPESIFSFLSSVGKNGTKDTTKETEVKYCK